MSDPDPDPASPVPSPSAVERSAGPAVWEPVEHPEGEEVSLYDTSSIPADFRAGFIAVVGRPNVGKSTLINQFIGQKISIVSDRPQTTRTRLLGILHEPECQIVFVDTPGIHQPLHRLGEYMMSAARQSLVDADVIAFLVDLSAPPTEEDRLAAQTVFAKPEAPIILVGNKIDLLKNLKPDAALERFKSLGPFPQTLVISASRGDHLDDLLTLFKSHLPISPPFYPPDEITDQPERVIAAELIREAVLRHTHQEIPHAVAVVVDAFKERENGLFDISATLYVERDSQKGILIGKGGAMLKTVGQDARAEIEAMLDAKIFLQLWVKVREKWRKKDPQLRQMGYRTT